MPHKTIPDYLRRNAGKLRSDMTPEEKKLWQVVRAHRLEGISFRRQVPISGYVVDFAAPIHRLIVELDGSQHGDADGLDRDLARDADLRSLGWTVLRFWNRDINENLDGACRAILSACGRAQG